MTENSSHELTRTSALEKRSRRFVILTNIGIGVNVLAFFAVWLLFISTRDIFDLIFPVRIVALPIGISVLAGICIFILVQMQQLEKWALYAFCSLFAIGIVSQLILQNWAIAILGAVICSCYLIFYLRKDWTLFQWDFPSESSVSEVENISNSHKRYYASQLRNTEVDSRTVDF